MLVLTTIKEKTPISRASVAQLTGLNKGTVSSLVSELIDEDLIEESGPGKSSGGRRPVMLLFNGRAGYSISIDLGVGYILGLLTDLNGEIIYKEHITYQQTDFRQVYPKLVALIEQLQAGAPKSPYGIIGIGVGVPGVISHQGEILLAPNLNWKEIKLKQLLVDKFSIPVVIENEADAGAYGEKIFGSGQITDNIIYISISMGIGVGLIMGGELYNGAHGFAGELGHMTIVKDGRPCRCGNIGCWERYASEQALIQQAIQLNIISKDDVTPFDKLIRLAENQDPKTLKLFEQISEYIGIGLTNSINIFNPELVILGNQLSKAEKWISPTLNKYVNKHAIGFHQQDLSVQFSKLASHSSALGIAAFSIENFLNRAN